MHKVLGRDEANAVQTLSVGRLPVRLSPLTFATI